jgi:uncharacterized protein (TIGR02246 family)
MSKAQAQETTHEAQIRTLIENRAKAVRAKDANAPLSNYAPEFLAFDVINPLRYSGSDALRKRMEDWLSSFQGPVGYEIRDLSITAGEDVAFCHFLNQIRGTRKDGGEIEMWWRATVCLRKVDGRWLITHEHNSVPFDGETGKASIDLTP